MLDALPVPEILPDARTARQLRVLEELTEIGMDLARDLRDRVRAAPEAVGSPRDVELAFSRISRAVRLTLALETRLLEAPRAAAAMVATEQAQAAWREGNAAAGRHIRRMVTADQVRDLVEQAVEAEGVERDFERLSVDLEERLVEAAEEEDFLQRPISEVVGRICADLGVTPDWELWRFDDWAQAEAKARPRRGPYAKFALPRAQMRGVSASFDSRPRGRGSG